MENFRYNNYDFNECTAKGSCSILPNVSAIQEIMLVLIRELSHYVKKLKRLNFDMPNLELKILHVLSEYISVAEFTDDDVLFTLQALNKDLNILKRKYNSICKKKNITCSEISDFVTLEKFTTLPEIISLGEKLYLKKITKLTKEEKFYTDTLLIALKSLSSNILKLLDYKIESPDAIDKILDSLNLFNFGKFPLERIKKYIPNIAKIEHELLQKRAEMQMSKFGTISEVSVSSSTRKNHAVLVSGSSMSDLYDFLEFTKDIEDLDVYSHGDLIIAHAFKKFKVFKNFVGHYGTGNENCIFDFATFPGAILLTRHSKQNIENLIRGRIYTMDTVQPKGAIKVNNKEFNKIVESSKSAKGFKKGQTRPEVHVGIDFKKLDLEILKLRKKIEKNEIKKVLIVGMSQNAPLTNSYLNDVIDKLSDKIAIISFSSQKLNKPHLALNIASNYPLMYIIVSKILEQIDISKLCFYLLKCDPVAISAIIQLKNYGAPQILMSSCSPMVMNPTTLEQFAQKYKVHLSTSQEKDIAEIER